MARIHGERGRAWLAGLPALLDACRALWSLELGEPFENLSYNFVLPARDAHGAEVVLKLGVPCAELRAEASALGLFAGASAVRLLNRDDERGVLLLERALPGTPLKELTDDAEATRVAAGLLRRLRRDPPDAHTFPTLDGWFLAFERLRGRFGGTSGPFPTDLLARAERTFHELNASRDQTLLLHGDLHHENILSDAVRGWLAIDPKGVCGDPGYEVGPFMMNRLPAGASDESLRELFERRLTIFSEELGINKERLAGWAFCHAVLSGVWDTEESADVRRAARLARVLGAL